MQVQRLFEIVYLLLNQKKISAKQLASHFGVSTRTIYRDIEVLSVSGIPIYTEQGKHGGIGLLEDFVLPKSVLSKQEQQDILLALQSLGELTPNDNIAVLDKLGSLFQKKIVNWIDVDFSNWGASKEEQMLFSILKESILTAHVIQFVYYNTQKEVIKREVEPLQLYFKNKAWYLKGYCCSKQDFRTFKISRIKNLQVVDRVFERKEIPVQRPSQIAVPLIQLTLKIKKEAAYRVMDEYPMDCVETDPNGDYIVSIAFPENDWVYGYILSFGEDIEVLAPLPVREKIEQKLQKMLLLYK